MAGHRVTQAADWVRDHTLPSTTDEQRRVLCQIACNYFGVPERADEVLALMQAPALFGRMFDSVVIVAAEARP